MVDKDALRRSIAELKTEISELDDTDVESRDELRDLAEQMEARLYAEEREEEPTPMHGITELIERYEARYPRVTAIANDIMTRLANMGI